MEKAVLQAQILNTENLQRKEILEMVGKKLCTWETLCTLLGVKESNHTSNIKLGCFCTCFPQD